MSGSWARMVFGRPLDAGARPLRRAGGLIARTIRATRLLVGDRRVPRPLRWIVGLSLLPIPGPFDEVVLLLVAPLLFVFYGEPLRDAWRRAGGGS